MQLSYQNSLDGAGAALSGYGDDSVVQPEFESQTFSLRRTGHRPLFFKGREIAHAMSFRVGTPMWYELNLFMIDGGGYVGDVRMFTKSDDEQDRFTVSVGASLDDVVTFFENYDPAQDVSAEINLDDGKSIAEAAFEALAVRARVEVARQQYQTLVTEVLGQLGEEELHSVCAVS